MLLLLPTLTDDEDKEADEPLEDEVLAGGLLGLPLLGMPLHNGRNIRIMNRRYRRSFANISTLKKLSALEHTIVVTHHQTRYSGLLLQRQSCSLSTDY
jgi:hypothetical protein